MSVSIAELQAMIGADLSGLEKGLKETKQKLEQLGSGVPAKGIDSFVDRARASLTKLGSSMTGIGQAISIGVTLPLTLLGKKIFDIGAEYERGMNVFKVVTQATSAEMAKAAQVAEALGNDLTLPGISAGDAAAAMTELGKAGFDAAQAMTGARGVLELATTATIGAGQAATITANALQAFGLAASESGRIADLLAASANATSAEITDVALAMQQSSASAHALKIPVEDLTAAIGIMANNAIKGSDAGTSLKTFMNALTPSTKAAASAMKELGIDAFDAKGNFVGLEEVIRQAAPALARMTDEQRAATIETAFGSDAQRAANIILGEGVVKWNEMLDAVTKEGAAAELAAAKSKGLSGAVEAFGSSLETAAITIYKQFAPGLESIVLKMGDMVNGLSKASPEFVTFGVTAAAVFAASGPLVLGIGKVVTMLGNLSPQGVAITAAIAGVAALAGAYVANFSGMQNVIDRFFTDFSEHNAGLGRETDGSSAAWVRFVAALTQGVDTALHALKSLGVTLTTIGRVMIDAMTGQWGKIASDWTAGMASLTKADAAFRSDLNNRAIEFRHGYATTWSNTANDVGFAFVKGLGKSGVEIQVVTAAMGKEAAKIAAENFKKGMGDYKSLYESALADVIKASKGPAMKAAEDVGFSTGSRLGSSQKKGYLDQVFQSPFFVIHTLMDALAQGMIVAGKFDAVGSKIGKSLKQGMVASGFEGFDKLVDSTFKMFIEGSDKLEKAIAPGFKKVAKGINEAFSEIVTSINKYLATQSKGVQLTEEEIFKLPRIYKEALGRAAHEMKLFEEDSKRMAIVIAATPEVAKKAFDTLIQKAKELRDTAIPVNDAIGVSAGKLSERIAQSAAIQKIAHEQIQTTYEKDKLAAQISTQSQIENAEKLHDSLISAYEDVSRRVPQFVKDIADGVANASGKLGDDVLKMSTKVQGAIGSIIGVVTTLPLPFAESARKVLATVDQWFQWGDQVLELLNRMGIDVPNNMSQLVEKIVVKFKDGFGKVLDSLKGFGQSLLGGLKDIFGKVGSLFQGGGGQALGFGLGAGGLLGGLKLGGFGGTILSGAGIGAMIGSIVPGIGTLFGAGVGAVGGAIVGGIKKLFGGGKSEAEKTAAEQMKLQAQGLQLGIDKGKQDLQQAIAKTASDVFDLIDKFGAGARVPKEVIKNAVKDIAFTLKQLAKELSRIADEATPELAAAMERYKGVVEIGAAAPLALEMISRHIPVAQTAITNFVSDWSKVVIAFGEAAIEIPNKLEKQAAKLAERTGGVAEFIKNTFEALAGFFNVKKVQQSDVDTFVGNTEMIISGLAGASERLDKYGVKQAGILSERGTVILGFVKAYADVQKDIVDTPFVTESDVERFLNSGKLLLEKAVSTLATVVTEGLAKASVVAESSGSIFGLLNSVGGGLKAAIDAATSETPDFSKLATTIRTWIDTVIQIANEVSIEAVGAAATLSEGADSIFKFLSSVAGALKSADGIFATAFDFGFVKGAALGMIDIVVQLANETSTVGVKAASDFATSTTAITGFLTSVANAYKAIKESAGLTVQGVIDTVKGYGILIEQLRILSRDIGPEGIAAATTFTGQIAQIADAGMRALGFYNALAVAKMVGKEQWDILVENMSAMQAAMSRASGLMHDALGMSLSLRSDSEMTRDNVLAAIAAINQMGAAAAGAIGSVANALPQGGSVSSTSFASPIAPSSFAASSFAPSRFGASSSGAPAVEFHAHFHGPVSSESAAKDMVVRGWEGAATEGLVPHIKNIATKK